MTMKTSKFSTKFNNSVIHGIVFLTLVFFSFTGLLGQYTSLDNNSGYWSDTNSWVRNTAPNLSSIGTDINCYGELFAINCLDIDSSTIYINDTLVINGNLELKNNARMVVGSHGVLLIFGDYTSNNNTEVVNNGIFVVAGDFRMLGSNNQGFFENNSGNLFLFDNTPILKSGSLYSSIKCDEIGNYPVNCSFGNENDLTQNSIYNYFTSLSYYKRNLSFDGNKCFSVEIEAASSSLCRNEEVEIEINSVGINANDTLLLNFGEGAIPPTAYGFGPHVIHYETVGEKSIELNIPGDTVISFENYFSISSCIELDFAVNKYVACIGDTIEYTNLSVGINPIDYILWDFGEGAVPISLSGFGPHEVLYKSSGAKDISLTILNDTFLVKPSLIYISQCLPLNYQVDKTSACIGDTVTFQNTNFEEESFDTLTWNFGEGAIPQNATGKGPHKIIYETAGEKEFSLSLKSGLVPNVRVRNQINIGETPLTSDIIVEEQTGFGMSTYLDEVCLKTSRIYSVNGEEGSTYKWTIPALNISNLGNDSFEINWNFAAGGYLIFVQEISKENCYGTVSDAVVLLKECKNKELTKSINYTFTPNNDGFNDKWVIDNIEDYPLAKVFVFDRAGKLVYKNDGNYQNDWDGTHRGQLLKLDSYYYLIDLSAYNKESIRGIVTLIH